MFPMPKLLDFVKSALRLVLSDRVEMQVTIFIFIFILGMLWVSSWSVAGSLKPPSCPPVMTAANIVGGVDPRSNSSRVRVLMPWKLGFTEFVNFNNATCMLDGFSVQVFRHVLDLMGPRAPPIHIILHGNGTMTPPYNEMVDKVFNGEADAIVADLTVTTARMSKVGYTLPYLPAKLVMVTPFRYASERTAWDFLKPFSKQLWVTLLACFAATGLTLYVLENKNPEFDKHHKHKATLAGHNVQQSSPSEFSTQAQHDNAAATGDEDNGNVNTAFDKRRFLNAYWFTSLCVFAAPQESIRTHLGRVVTLSWLFVMFIMFNASYTASLASLLSAQKRYPVVQGFQALLKNDNISVGYQEGSFIGSFLNNLTISQGRLKPYSSNDNFIKGLLQGSAHGGVDAIIDEVPFIQPILQRCDFITNSANDGLPTFGGFGFAFARNSPLINEVSKEIIVLIENMTIKQLQKNWTIGGGGQNDAVDDCNSSKLRFNNFAGLFGIVGCGYLVCISLAFFKIVLKDRNLVFFKGDHISFRCWFRS